MRRQQLFKRILAGSLILGLTVLDAMPAMAADMQSPDSVIEAEAESEEALLPAEEETLDAAAEEEVLEPQTETKKAEGDTDTTPAISVTDFTQPSANSGYAELSYEKLNNCNYVKLSVKDSRTNKEVYSNEGYYSGESIYVSDFTGGVVAGVKYIFTLTPYGYDENNQEILGDPVSKEWTVPAIEKISGLAVKEMTSSGFVFSHSAVSKDTTVYYQYSENKDFNEDIADVDSTTGSLRYGSLTPGVTYYVRAYVSCYGVRNYSNVVTVSAPVAEVTDIFTEIFDTGITLEMNTGYGDFTGFQIARKSGKGKYQNLTTTTDSIYKDTGLKKNTKYTYRVRAYYYNVDTKKTVYGSYEYKTVQTGKARMDLKAKAAGKNSIKLTWKKVPGAVGYEVYRYTGSSSSNTYKAGENYSFSKYELVKKLSKKKASYTDKKLVSGEEYSYIVKAYKRVKGKNVYFMEEKDSASTKFSFSTSVNVYKEAQSPKNGKVKIAWYPIPQAKGYLIEKYDEAKEDWVTQKKIKKAKTTSYTLPASPLGKTVEYRIRAYSGKKYSGADEVEVSGHIAAVTGVKASSTKDGIKVSWKKVSGASYYRVYRSLDSSSGYNADTKTYYYNGRTDNVEPKVFKAADASSNYYYTLSSSAAKLQRDYEAEKKLVYSRPSSEYYDDDAIIGTSVIDYAYSSHSLERNAQGAVTKDNVRKLGPQSDVTYYYYVVAYRDIKNADGSYDTARSYGSSKAASASLSGSAAVKKPVIKAKAGSKSATITYKKVKNAKKYYIYRSDSKKGAFKLVGTTSKLKFKDKKLTSKKTYRYKVRAISKNSMGADKFSAYSKVKSVKAK